MTDPASMFAPIDPAEVVEPEPAPVDWHPVIPVPDDVKGAIPPHRLGKPSAFWVYRDDAGRRLFVVCRFDHDGGKDTLPLSYCEAADGRREWRWKGLPVPRPLYGLDRLAGRPDAPVVVVEGEKTADAAGKLFPDVVAVTSPGGSKAAGKADWSPLAGRNVTVWRDADEPGMAYEAEVVRLVTDAGAAGVATVAVPADFPVGWDVADEPPAGWDHEALRDVLLSAIPSTAANDDAPAVDHAQAKQPAAPAAPEPLFRDLPPADPFPVAALRGILAPAAEGIQAKVQAPAAICAQSVLAAASLAVQGHADVILPTGHRKPLSLFCVTVAASGERKSAVDAEALWPIRKREVVLRDAYGPEVEDWQNDMAAWTKARDEALKKGRDRQSIKTALDILGPAPGAPLLPFLTMNEPNWPGLCRAFDEGLPTLGLFSAEGGGFLGGHGMSEENRLRTATGLSELWDGEPIRRARGGEGIKIMPGRRLALHLMMQPGVADKLLGDPLMVDQGLTARMLVVAPDSLAGSRMWKEVPPEADAAIRRYGARLLAALEAPLPVPPGKRNELEPRGLPLSDDARRLWIATADATERQIGAGGPLEPVRSFANKAPEHAARIAAVLALVEDIHAAEVSAAHLAAAVELVGHYTAEALRLKAAGAVGGDLMLAQRLVEWLRQWPEPLISLPDIYRTGPGPIRDKKTAARIVSILTDHGYLIEAGAGEVGGRNRRETWRIWKG